MPAISAAGPTTCTEQPELEHLSAVPLARMDAVKSSRDGNPDTLLSGVRAKLSLVKFGVFRADGRAAERHRGLMVNMLLNVTSGLAVMFAVPLLVHCMGVKRLRHLSEVEKI
ncbi:MAG: hypothetical protein MPJ50_07225 [Pirellulales bacterium]|nr:hypothetical protein [Pirellulales bacterium]